LLKGLLKIIEKGGKKMKTKNVKKDKKKKTEEREEK